MQKIYLLGAAILLSPVFLNAQNDCTSHHQVSNNFENGFYIETNGIATIANDFKITANM